MSIYDSWNFKSDPFDTRELPPDKLGAELLVGREEELAALERRVLTPPNIPSVEGMHGIGKTSLVNVMLFRCQTQQIEQGYGRLYIPCTEAFRLRPIDQIEIFEDQVYIALAKTILDNIELLRSRGQNLEYIDSIENLLRTPGVQFYTAKIRKFEGEYGSPSPTPPRDLRGEFRTQVRSWLSELFPTDNWGGIVCLLDNVELLKSVPRARQLLEQLRDSLFKMPGVRWIMCGSWGIILGVVSSSRLEGIIHRPITLSAVPERFAMEILESRLRAYTKPGNSHYIPFLRSDFITLYDIMKGNIRYTLSGIGDFCQWVCDKPREPKADLDKHYLFMQWLQERTVDEYKKLYNVLSAEAWQIFEAAVKHRGEFSRHDFTNLIKNDKSILGVKGKTLRKGMDELREHLLLSHDPDDTKHKRARKNHYVTTRGWLVNRALGAVKSKQGNVIDMATADIGAPSDSRSLREYIEPSPVISLEPNVFISYTRKDLAAAKALVEDLKRRGVRPWFDVDVLLPGQDWKKAIRAAIRKCRAFIVLLSANSLAKPGFLQEEIRLALEVLNEMPEDSVYLIPARLDDCQIQHERLTMIQWVDLFPDSSAGFSRILESLRFAGLTID